MTEYKDPPHLSSAEKEVTMRFSRDSYDLKVTAEVSSWVRWLDEHPEFQEDWRRSHDGAVTAISGTLPLSALHLSWVPRKDDTPSSALGQPPEVQSDG